MKLVIAYIQPDRLAEVKKNLYKAKVYMMSASKANGCGQQKGFIESFRGTISEVNLLPKIRLEIAVNDSYLEATVKAIVKGAKTGNIGDGKIFVLELMECVRIRTGEKGALAIGGESAEASASLHKV